MAKGKVFIEAGGPSYAKMWTRWGWTYTSLIKEADVIQFTGGSDVYPKLYGEEVHPQTGYDKDRDEHCLNLYEYGLKHGLPLTGICRGGQFLNVANGGKMFQHCDGHAIYGTHKATVLDSGLVVDVTSTHHQIMRPNRETGIVLMEADKLGTFKQHMAKKFNNGNPIWIVQDLQQEDDCEAVYYSDSNSLCFQPHPEYCDEESSCVQTYKHFLKNYLELDV